MEINKLSFEEGFRAIAELCDWMDKKYADQAEQQRIADRAKHRDESLAACLARKARYNPSYRGYGNAEPGSPTEEQLKAWIEQLEPYEEG